MIPAKDISQYQGQYVDTGEPIQMVKISGGDDGLYIDSRASENYNGVIRAGRAFGGYHFAGGGDPVTEANFFCNAMLPWNPGEVPALDWEINHPDPVGWCLAFINQVQKVTGNPGGLIYMNLNTLNHYDWSPVLAKWGLWLADWTGDPTGSTVDTDKTVVMLQYNDGPTYDRDEWYGTIEQFKKYGWQGASAPTPQPPTTPAPDPTPPTTEPPTTPPPVEPDPTPDPDPSTPPTTTPQPQPPAPGGSPTPPVEPDQPDQGSTFWLIRFFKAIIKWLRS